MPVTATAANSGYTFSSWTGNVANCKQQFDHRHHRALRKLRPRISLRAAVDIRRSSPAKTHLGSGVYYLQFPDGNPFGYYNFPSSSILYHYDMGFEGFIPGSAADIYLYDFTSNHWWYTSIDVISLPVRLHAEHVDLLFPEHDQSGSLHHESALFLESGHGEDLHDVGSPFPFTQRGARNVGGLHPLRRLPPIAVVRLVGHPKLGGFGTKSRPVSLNVHRQGPCLVNSQLPRDPWRFGRRKGFRDRLETPSGTHSPIGRLFLTIRPKQKGPTFTGIPAVDVRRLAYETADYGRRAFITGTTTNFADIHSPSCARFVNGPEKLPPRNQMRDFPVR